VGGEVSQFQWANSSDQELRTGSVGGIHPQYAEELADSPRVERLKARKKVEKPKGKVANANALNAWHKRCPKCRTQVHIRKLTCGCGHQFS
jgi:hypothetical protein